MLHCFEKCVGFYSKGHNNNINIQVGAIYNAQYAKTRYVVYLVHLEGIGGRIQGVASRSQTRCVLFGVCVATIAQVVKRNGCLEFYNKAIISR